MNDIMKIVMSLKDAGLLLKGVTKTVENEAEEKMGEFLGMLAVTLSAALLGNILQVKGLYKQVKEQAEQVRIFNVTSSLN